ncbi:MAG: SUMF1/EgtB/PvdO family nonheme iron enzyme [Candidatus Hydrogenedentes bacterium]|nr:SUMF1/EgtB/PvdO family nonheme iron enzyme [Candidatus Hydrogenedentota bacterium]
MPVPRRRYRLLAVVLALGCCLAFGLGFLYQNSLLPVPMEGDRGVGGTAAPQGPDPGGPDPTPDSRYALVMGNAAYADSRLLNPVNDATAVSEALRDVGFDVALHTDCTHEQMEESVRVFGERIRGAGAALFYFAGHGMQVEGQNYLVPVDARIEAENEAKFRCLNAGLVLAKMENAGAAVNLIILDACRNDPFARRFRSAAQGLASMDAARGTLIAYATAPGQVAQDTGAGEHSVYTGSLLRYLCEPGLRVEDVFKRVRAEVMAATGDKQVPWENTSLVSDFYFARAYAVGPGTGETRPPTVVTPSPPPPPVPITGHLQVNVNVSDAAVSVNGENRGTAGPGAPLNIQDLPAGTVTVVVEAPDHERAERTVSIVRNEWTQEVFELAAPGPDPGDVQTVDLGGGVSLELVWCPPGTFLMGGDQSPEEVARLCGGLIAEVDWFRDEQPQHQVTLTQGFWMGKCEVTQGQWERVMGNNPSYFKGDPLLPVETVSWEVCQEFIEKLNGRVSGGGFRLPTEAQWEYACRAGTTTPFPFGQTISTEQGNYDGNYTYGNGRKGVYREKTLLVGSFPANAWGLHEMHGNLWEWCSDWFGDYASGTVTDPAGPSSGNCRVVRGGSWDREPGFCRSAFRLGATPDSRNAHYGVRLSRTP